MKDELKKPEYAKLKLVDTVYGDDQDDEELHRGARPDSRNTPT